MLAINKIIQIVPRLPPAIDGVGDYALNLAHQLRKDFRVQTHFIVGNPTWTGELELDGFLISHVTNNSANILFKFLEDRSCPIILHYVGYGYAKRGCPVWLVEALETWKQEHENFQLVTMFHEICASGPIWASSFWLSGLQQNLAKRLALVSDRLITSKQLYAQILEKLSGGKHCQIPALPVFSNIGEPKEVPQLQHRTQNLVIFGSPATRRRAYGQSQEAIGKACHFFHIEKILDIGSPLEESPNQIGVTPITALGELPPQEISKILIESFAGFIHYASDFLGKSTIFAAYCAHGNLVIQSGSPVKETCGDGIEEGKHYLNPQNLRILNRNSSLEDSEPFPLQTIVSNAHEWYQNHSLQKQSQLFYNLL
jgi:hypothetical protein